MIKYNVRNIKSMWQWITVITVTVTCLHNLTPLGFSLIGACQKYSEALLCVSFQNLDTSYTLYYIDGNTRGQTDEWHRQMKSILLTYSTGRDLKTYTLSINIISHSIINFAIPTGTQWGLHPSGFDAPPGIAGKTIKIGSYLQELFTVSLEQPVNIYAY